MSVITQQPEEGTGIGPENVAMLYSASALRSVEDLKNRVGRFIKDSALELAKKQGRSLVTDDDVWAIIDQLELKMPDEAEDE